MRLFSAYGIETNTAARMRGRRAVARTAGMGLLHLFAGGLFLIGIIIDLIALLGKPNPHYI